MISAIKLYIDLPWEFLILWDICIFYSGELWKTGTISQEEKPGLYVESSKKGKGKQN